MKQMEKMDKQEQFLLNLVLLKGSMLLKSKTVAAKRVPDLLVTMNMM